MKKFRIIFSILCLLIFLSPRCIYKRDVENSVLFKNNTTIDLYCIPSFEYPDTTLHFIDRDIIYANYNRHLLPANSEIKLQLHPFCDSITWRNLNKHGVVQFFFLDKNIVDSCNWNLTSDIKKIVKREEYTYIELINNHCTITFDLD